MKSFDFATSPRWIPSSALTIVTEEQIRMNVLAAVSQMFRTFFGSGHVEPKRRTM